MMALLEALDGSRAMEYGSLVDTPMFHTFAISFYERAIGRRTTGARPALERVCVLWPHPFARSVNLDAR